MTAFEEFQDRIERIEASMDERPGDAQGELETVILELGETIAERQVEARQLMRNEDFAGAANLLVENGLLLLQRIVSLLLDLREQIRRRR